MGAVNWRKSTQLCPSRVELIVHFSPGISTYIVVHIGDARHRHGEHYGQLGFKSAPATGYITRPWKDRIALAAGIACTYQVKQAFFRMVFSVAITQHFCPVMAIKVMEVL